MLAKDALDHYRPYIFGCHHGDSSKANYVTEISNACDQNVLMTVEMRSGSRPVSQNAFKTI